MKLFFKILTCIFLSILAIGASFTVYAGAITSNVKLDKTKLLSSTQCMLFLDNNNDEIMDDSIKNSKKINVKHLPNHVKEAFIAIEDKRFYKHKGIDLKRIIGASIKNLKYRSYKEGASTISQQLIKNTHLSNEKTIKRKLKEIKLTLQLERRYSKDNILEMYLNTIYFGENCYGIESASLTYFGKASSQLLPHESALLASIIKAPSTYSPFKNPNKALERRNIVLRCMREQGFITKEEYETYLTAQLGVIPHAKDLTEKYYLNCAKDELEEILKNTNYSFYDTFNVYTYYDNSLSEMLSNEIKEQLPNCGYCGIITDNISHGVLAVSTDTGFIKRNPASTVKPWLIYAPAIEENEISIATKILDSKTDFNGFYPCNNNEKYYGYVSAKDALIKSLNVPAVKLANCLGVEKIKKYAQKMNVNAGDNLGMALGDIEEGLTLKELTDCYSVFSSNGYYTESKFIRQITTKEGKVIYSHNPNGNQIFSDSTVYVINDALKECAQTGTAKKLKLTNLPICAKTGTNGTKSGNFDAYCISYSPEFTVGTWLGNADNSYMNNSISGGTYPTIISCEIWNNINKTHDITNFIRPESVIECSINKKEYDENYKIEYGNGPSFLFRKGTEPNKIYKIDSINNSIENGKVKLSFEIIGYDGVDVELNNKPTVCKNFTERHPKCLLETNTPLSYVITISPYTINENNEKIYSNIITLTPSKREQNKEDAPPNLENNWWNDD